MSNADPAVASSLLIDGAVYSSTNLEGSGEANIHPTVLSFLTSFPAASQNALVGLCAESTLISDQFWKIESEVTASGSHVTLEEAKPYFRDAAIISRLITQTGDPQHGQLIPPCNACSALIEFLNIERLS